LALGATIIVVAVTLLFTGSVVFFDPNREIVSAQIVDGFGRRQNLMNVGFAYVGLPKLEGSVQLKCAHGKTVRIGYVTPGASTWQRMGKNGECLPRPTIFPADRLPEPQYNSTPK
jgi:hypothetical protein